MSEVDNEKNVFIETLEWICRKLKSANVPYMITGGAAVGFWGHISFSQTMRKLSRFIQD